MPTLKPRINLSVPVQVNKTLHKIAKRDHTSVSAKTLELVCMALEIEEDAVFLQHTQQRKAVKGPFLSHKDAWV